MPLNIKDDQIHSKAKQIAALTGDSITSVVRQALNDHMDKLLSSRDRMKADFKTTKSARLEQLLALANICAKANQSKATSAGHAELYGDDGLPL